MKNYSALLFAISILLLSCQQQKEQSERVVEETELISLNQEQMQTIQLKTATVEQRNMKNVVKAIGYFHVPPKYLANVSPVIGGYITRTRLLVGDYVKKGQVLATLENPEYIELQRDFMQAANQLQSLKSDYERQKKLFADSISAEKDLISAETEYKNMLARYQANRHKLLMLNLSPQKIEEGHFYQTVNLVSPISGYVTLNNTSLGQYVTPAEKLFEIMDKSHLHLELAVHENDAIKIKKGQRVNFTVPGIGDEMYQAEVFLVGQSLQGTERTVTVHAHLLEGKTLEFISQMYVNAEIIVKDQRVASLPEEAVIRSGKKAYIFVKTSENNESTSFEQVEIKTGSSSDGYIGIEPATELPTNAEVVTHGAYYLLSAAGMQGS
ncbi:MAG: efflux RND transporter periplasmic adaptor subunit [Cyclobacteriaceae bacterium]